jgi:hypothetical protein
VEYGPVVKGQGNLTYLTLALKMKQALIGLAKPKTTCAYSNVRCAGGFAQM